MFKEDFLNVLHKEKDIKGCKDKDLKKKLKNELLELQNKKSESEKKIKEFYEFIKLYKFSIERYVVKKNTINPIKENTICLDKILVVSNSIDSIELNNVNHEMTLNNINWSRMYKLVPSGPNIVIFRFIIL